MEGEIRAVVLGWQKSDKASVINAILGEEVASDKHIVKSVKTDGEANGRKISLINTPCWWEIFSLQDSPEVVKQELVCSVFKCHPGPHVFLLVINLSLPFTEENRLSIEKHLSLFGERIWRHTIVIFTRADSLTPIRQLIQIQGEDLRRIIRRCGETFHVFEDDNKSAGVQELLVEIDRNVAANNGKHFDTRDEELLKIKRRRDENEERAKARQEMFQSRRELMKEIREGPRPALRLVLLGWNLSGKSSAANTIFPDQHVEKEGTVKCQKYSGVVNGRNVTVLDTPGWWKYFSPKFNPQFAQASILESVGRSQHMRHPHAMILVIPIDTSFGNRQKRIIEENMATLGEDVWRHTMVLFTWADRFPDISLERHIESEGEALQWLIEKCRNRYHVFDNTNKNNGAQVTELLQKIDEMAAENSVFCLNTQCDVEVSADVSDAQQDEELTLNGDQFLQLLYVELKNRSREMKRKLKALGMDVSESSRWSMDSPIQLKADEEVMEKIRREISRWDAIIMDGLWAAYGKTMMVSSHEMVSQWLENCEEYSITKTSGYEMIFEHLQKETSDDTATLR